MSHAYKIHLEVLIICLLWELGLVRRNHTGDFMGESGLECCPPHRGFCMNEEPTLYLSYRDLGVDFLCHKLVYAG